MKTQFLILIVLFITVQSCQQPKEIVRETVVVSNRSQQTTGGTDQVGGGNGIDGIPLDAFIQDIQKNSGYKNKIEPLIQKLSTLYPQLAADIYHLSHQRDWYFVPGKLAAISQNILGTYAPTDQIALQDTNKIWIDKNQFSIMNEDNQAVLILHELIMGVNLLQYKHRQDQCIAKAAILLFSENGPEKYSNEKKFCRNTYPMIEGTANEKFDPKAINYDKIRRVVSVLIQDEIDIAEIKALFKNYKIREYEDEN
jgi:hypothetical protein